MFPLCLLTLEGSFSVDAKEWRTSGLLSPQGPHILSTALSLLGSPGCSCTHSPGLTHGFLPGRNVRRKHPRISSTLWTSRGTMLRSQPSTWTGTRGAVLSSMECWPWISNCSAAPRWGKFSLGAQYSFCFAPCRLGSDAQVVALLRALGPSWALTQLSSGCLVCFVSSSQLMSN